MARKARPKRRKPNTGTVRYRPERAAAPWEAEWRRPDGSRDYHSVSSRSDAEAWLDARVAERAAGRDEVGSAQTFATFIPKWLAIKAAKIGANTAHSYTYYCELASGEGGLGPRRLESITPETMEYLFLHFHKKGFKNLAQMAAPLKQAFAYAKRLKYITENPMDELELPRVERAPIVVLTAQQRAHMLTVAADEHDPDVPLLALWHLYSRRALRKGEGIALRWSSVDMDARTITIKESVTNVGADNLRGKTKTHRMRVVPIPEDIHALLIAHREWQRTKGIRALVFTDAAGEELTPQHVQYRWSLLRTKAGIPTVKIHGLRHTALYLMALDGVPQNVRQALAGHESEAMAQMYVNHASVDDIRRWVG